FCGMRLGPESPDFPRVLEHQQIWGELMAHTCEQPELQVQSPLLDLEPWQVIDLAFQISAPLDLTWSCKNQTGDPCGQCRGCAEREGAFIRAGRADPVLKDKRRVG
ncbi:MAG TPA: 7-cyano-7-deazaguanine synthase, partial [Tepidisphaeraceae bacterium]|nr:7-cyano-7-deazaguanine synthase [Tepidisphaeraceae bacterium]